MISIYFIGFLLKLRKLNFSAVEKSLCLKERNNFKIDMKTLVAKPLEAPRSTLGKVRGDKLPMRKFMRKFTVK